MIESYGISTDERFTTKEMARLLGVYKETLMMWRRRGKGPPFIKVVGRVYYPKGAFEEWLGKNMHNV